MNKRVTFEFSDFEKFPEESKNLILEAIGFYQQLKEKKLTEEEEDYLTDIEKGYVALLIAACYDDEIGPEIIKVDSEGILMNQIIQLIEYYELEDKEVTKEEFKTSYETIFQPILNQIQLNNYQIFFKESIALIALQNECIHSILEGENEEIEDIILASRINLTKIEYEKYDEAVKNIDSEELPTIMLQVKDFPIEALCEIFPNMQIELLKNYGEFLDEKEYETNPAIGREEEIKNLSAAILSPDISVLLTGEAGVGKKAIIEGLAYQIQNGQVPKELKEKKIFMLDVSKVMEETSTRGSFEEKINHIISLIEKHPNIIVYINDLPSLIYSPSTLHFIPYLKENINNGKMRVIATSTDEDYEEYIEPVSDFKVQFERQKIKEPKKSLTVNILKETITKMEEATQISFGYNNEKKDKILKTLVEITDKSHQSFDDIVYNPTLSLNILKKSFGYAILNQEKEVKIPHVIEAVRASGRINPSAQERYIYRFKRLDQEETKEKNKIIAFPTTKKIS